MPRQVKGSARTNLCEANKMPLKHLAIKLNIRREVAATEPSRGLRDDDISSTCELKDRYE
jgi:NH3-dependent NAD+ synthetase